jgi:hypothetical protein
MSDEAPAEDNVGADQQKDPQEVPPESPEVEQEEGKSPEQETVED